MTYVDTSVVLAHVLCEGARPPASFWDRPDLISSQLAEIEGWVRVHAYGKGPSHGAVLAETLARLDLVVIDDETTARCRAPFPIPVRTLDAIHLATADFLRNRGFQVEVAAFDSRLREAAAALGFAVVAL